MILINNPNLVGTVEINVNKQFSNGEFEVVAQELNILFNKKVAGTISITYELLTTNNIMNSFAKGYQYDSSNGIISVNDINLDLHDKVGGETIIHDSMFLEFQIDRDVENTKITKSKTNIFKWENEELEIRRESGYVLTVLLFEKNIFSKNLVGTGHLILKELVKNHNLNQQIIHIKKLNKIIGDLRANFNWQTDTEQRQGTLICRPISAKLERDTELIGQMDPFVQVTLGNQVKKSQTLDGAGKNPKWDPRDEMYFYRNNEYKIKVEVFDEDVTNNDLVGETTIKLSQIINQNFLEDDYTIYYNNKEAGQITLQWLWIPEFEERPGYIGIKTLNDEKIIIPGLDKKYHQTVYIRRLDEFFQKFILFDQDKKLIGEGVFPLCRIFQKSDVYFQFEVPLKKGIHFVEKNAQIEIAWHPDEELRQGYIQIYPVKAELERNTELIGKMDPVIEIEYQDQIWENEVCESGGKFPSWEKNSKNVLEFYRNQEFILKMRVLDRDVIYDDIVGTAKINLSDVFQSENGKIEIWIQILHNKKFAGKVLLEMNWIPDIFENLNNQEQNQEKIKIFGENQEKSKQYLKNNENMSDMQNQSCDLYETNQNFYNHNKPYVISTSPDKKKIFKDYEEDNNLKLKNILSNTKDVREQQKISSQAKFYPKKEEQENEDDQMKELLKQEEQNKKKQDKLAELEKQYQEKFNDKITKISINKSNMSQKGDTTPTNQKILDNNNILQDLNNQQKVQQDNNKQEFIKSIQQKLNPCRGTKNGVLAFTSSSLTQNYFNTLDGTKNIDLLKEQLGNEFQNDENLEKNLWKQHLQRNYEYEYLENQGDILKQQEQIVLHSNPPKFKETQFVDQIPGSQPVDWSKMF